MTLGPTSSDLVAFGDAVVRYCRRDHVAVSWPTGGRSADPPAGGRGTAPRARDRGPGVLDAECDIDMPGAAPASTGVGHRAGTLAADLVLKRSLINRLELDFARDAARFAATYSEDEYGNPGPVSWLRGECRMTSHAAATAVCVGEQAARLELSSTALVEGRIGFAHLGWMATTAAALEESASTNVVFNEAWLLGKAESLSVQRFRTECEHVRHAADRKAFLEQKLNDRDCRSLTLTPFEGGGVALAGSFDSEDGALLRSALDPLARWDGRDDVRSREQRYADALVELCSHRLDTGQIPQTASQRAHLQVTTTLETLRDLPGAPAAEIDCAGVIAAPSVQRLACDATITRVLVNARSQVIDVGRSERVVPASTRRALNIRDQGCRWPGCDRPPSWTSAHHVVHWAYLGPTDTDNLVLLCRHHHWCVHEGGWVLVRGEDGVILAVSPVAGTIFPLRAPAGARRARGPAWLLTG
ncbi:MAG: DUF222 domain-containing protein [Candidatus Dormibacteraeota bacterium]|uniref:DUF222 domain-containing protein n=1 Tax=Candidatus Amunia macphersoniae TaxID=3127014 RepID=A0A934KHT0_9BACT|nr:DUF222 domain-containing protein [Candidatus Dormibacteraeota bacterium]